MNLGSGELLVIAAIAVLPLALMGVVAFVMIKQASNRRQDRKRHV